MVHNTKTKSRAVLVSLVRKERSKCGSLYICESSVCSFLGHFCNKFYNVHCNKVGEVDLLHDMNHVRKQTVEKRSLRNPFTCTFVQCRIYIADGNSTVCSLFI